MFGVVMLVSLAYLNLSGVYTTITVAELFYNGSEARFKEVFAEFLAIPAVATHLGPLSYNEMTKLTQTQVTGPGYAVRTCLRLHYIVAH